jgi:excisionase family DNA binding protein
MQSLFYTTGEAAEELGISSARVRQMILTGAITAEKRGRDLLIPSGEIERAQQRSTSPGRPPKPVAGDQAGASPVIEAESPPKPAKKARKTATKKRRKG